MVNYPLVIEQFAIENCLVEIRPLEIVISHVNVSLPDGIFVGVCHDIELQLWVQNDT